MAKALYHSELVKAGTTTLEITGTPFKSKFGDNMCLGVRFNGDERIVQLENRECEDFFKDKKGQTISIQASGQKDAARIVLAGTPAPAPKSSSSSKPADDCAKFLQRAGLVYELAFKEGLKLKASLEPELEKEMPDAQFQAMVSSLFIAASVYCKDIPI